MYFCKVFGLVFTCVFVLLKLEAVLCVRCTYYPNYPSTYGLNTTCSDICCNVSYPTTTKAACCTKSSTDSPWWVSLIVFGVIAVAVSILVGLMKCCCKTGPCRFKTGGSPFNRGNNVGFFANNNPKPMIITNPQPYPPPQPFNYQNTYPNNQFNQFNQPVPPIAANNTDINPPSYDLFINQQSTINLNSSQDRPMPVLPAPIQDTENRNTNDRITQIEA